MSLEIVDNNPIKQTNPPTAIFAHLLVLFPG